METPTVKRGRSFLLLIRFLVGPQMQHWELAHVVFLYLSKQLNHNFKMKKHLLYLFAITMMIATSSNAQLVSPFVSSIYHPKAIAFDKTGNLFTANGDDGAISKITPSGVVSTFVYPGLVSPNALAFDNAGNLFVANGNYISKVNPNGVVSAFVNSSSISPTAIAFDKTGNLFTANANTNSISMITPSGIITTFVNTGLVGPNSLAFDSTGNLYVGDIKSIKKITPNGIVTQFVDSAFYGSRSFVFDRFDNLFLLSENAKSIFNVSKISNSGSVTTFLDFSTINRPASYNISALAFDSSGNLFIADYDNSSISKVSSSGSFIITFVNSVLNNLKALAIDKSNNLFVLDNNYTISKVTPSSVVNRFFHFGSLGTLSAVAIDDSDNVFVANSVTGVTYKINPAGSEVTSFINSNYRPMALAFDKSNNLYILNLSSDPNTNISKVSPNGASSIFFQTLFPINLKATLAFNNEGDLFLIKDSSISKISPSRVLTTFISGLNNPSSLAIDKSDNLFVANYYSNSISKITPSGVVTTFIDSGLSKPIALEFDNQGNLFVIQSSQTTPIVKITINNLPVELDFLKATFNNKNTEINWHTSTELNTSHFTIQHSTDGISFTDIGTVKAIGSGANGYQFINNNSANGINYYRLESVDKDGSISYSKVVSVQLSSINSQFSIFPNPAKDRATISFGKLIDKATIALYDITGKAIITQQINSNTSTYQLNTQKLTKGIYIVKFITGTSSVNGKLVIER